MISIPGCSSRMSASSRAANRISFWRHTKTPLVASVLILLVVATAGAGSMVSGQQHDKFSLLIGNAAYPGADTPLTDTITDARALGEELHRQGFDADVGENLSKAAMQHMLERFYTKITLGSTALIFFSGYGVQSNRESYMIPIDARIWVEGDVKRDGFSLDTVLAEMDRRGARVKIAILDASRRNPFEQLFRSGSAGLGAISAPQGTAVMMSAAPYSLVSESDSGVFMSELLKEMRVAGATVDGVFKRTRTGVSRATKSQQVPWFSSSLDEEFSFQSSSRPVNARPEPRPVPKPQPATVDPSRHRDLSLRRRSQARHQNLSLPRLSRARHQELSPRLRSRARHQNLSPPCRQHLTLWTRPFANWMRCPEQIRMFPPSLSAGSYMHKKLTFLAP